MAQATPKVEVLPRKVYEKELLELQAKIVEMAERVKREKKRMLLIFEGRDADGKGGGGKGECSNWVA